MKYLGKITNAKDLITKEYGENNFCGQVSSLPTASAELNGKIYQYTGTTTTDYTHGYFYECVTEGNDYWEIKWGDSGSIISTEYTSYSSKKIPSLSGEQVPLYDDTALTQATGNYGFLDSVYNSSGVLLGKVLSQTEHKATQTWQHIDTQPNITVLATRTTPTESGWYYIQDESSLEVYIA